MHMLLHSFSQKQFAEIIVQLHGFEDWYRGAYALEDQHAIQRGYFLAADGPACTWDSACVDTNINGGQHLINTGHQLVNLLY